MLGHAFLYGTGGLAFGNEHFGNVYADHTFQGAGDGSEKASSSQTKTGWALGAGIDYPFAPNWIVSAEYLHIDLGSISASGVVTGSGNNATATLNFSTKLTSDLLRLGIVYKL